MLSHKLQDVQVNQRQPKSMFTSKRGSLAKIRPADDGPKKFKDYTDQQIDVGGAKDLKASGGEV